MKIKLRLVYIGDVQYQTISPFEFNTETQRFHMLEDDSISYEPWAIVEDADWLVFELREDEDKNGIFHHVKQIPNYLIYQYDFVVGEL